MDVKIVYENIKFKFRVSAIVINNNKLLVNKYGPDSYCLPGGYVMIGEKAEDAIIRELKEETGLEFKILKFGGVTENFFTNLRNQKTHGIDFYYYVGLKNGSDNYDRLDLNFVENGKIEHHYSWIPIDNINNFNILPSVIKNSINLDGGLFHYTIDE